MMRDRFTRTSHVGRSRIRKAVRSHIYARDDFTCQYCLTRCVEERLTIDHIIPLALGGLDEAVNYVTCCIAGNQRKRDMSFNQFASTLARRGEDIPIHGDPVLDNPDIPPEIKEVRRGVILRMRLGKFHAGGKSAQKKIEKAYRRDFWQTESGKALEAEFPTLPGHARVMLPEIRAIAKNGQEALLLIELSKSANTRNLIGTTITAESDVIRLVNVMAQTSHD